MKACYLCKEPAQLQRSHIVPSFVGKWLKDTSVTGFLRHGIDQSLRQQDIPKQPLLRSSCCAAVVNFASQCLRTDLLVISSTPMRNRNWRIGGVRKGVLRSSPYDEWLLIGSAEHLHSVYASESDLLLRERRRRT